MANEKSKRDGLWVALYAEAGKGAFSGAQTFLVYGEVKGRWFYSEKGKKLISGCNFYLIAKVDNEKAAKKVISEITKNNLRRNGGGK